MHARDVWHTTTVVGNVRKKHGLVTKFGAGLGTSRARRRSGIELEDVNPTITRVEDELEEV